jgi:hypothetical protein
MVMSDRVLLIASFVATLPLLAVVPVDAQPGGAATVSEALRTSWGDPDLRGTWTNSTTTPMQRPADLEGQEFLSEEEWARRNPGSGLSFAEPTAGNPTGSYNDFWLEKGVLSKRTSLIIDPPNGRYPPPAPEAQARRRAQGANASPRPGPASWVDFGTLGRCLTRSMPGAMQPGFYNHNYQIFQTPHHVAILVEMIHDARIIPLDGPAEPSPTVTQWMGISRGHWEGNTLVVETTNLPDPNLTVVERLTRVGSDAIDYRVTVTNPTRWTAPWTALMPMATLEGSLFEFACHEGNYALPNMLAGARAEEAR